EVGPLIGNLRAMLLEQILAVVEQTGIDEPGHRDQMAIDGVIVDDRWEMLCLHLRRHKRREVEEVRCHQSWPDDVDLEYVDIGRLRRHHLEVEREAIGGGIGCRDEPDLVPCFLCPRLRAALAQLILLAESTARDRYRFGGRRLNREPENCN